MWIRSENSEALCPPEFEKTDTGVILRRNFEFVAEVPEEFPAHWTYDEIQLTDAQYEVWLAQQADIDYLSMENEYLEETAEQHQADIDYLFMVVDNEEE